MPFVYGVEGAPATPYATHATPNTEDPTMVLRQATRTTTAVKPGAASAAAQ